MARLEIKDLDYLARARRVVRRSGSYTLTVRYGKVYTYKVSRQNQPNSKEQKRQRGIFARANEIVAKELKREGRLEYWRKEAEKSGKNTARGAAMAYWCMRLKSENVNNTHFNYHIKKWKTEDCLSIDGRYNEILSRNIWIGRVNRLILQSLSKGKVAGGGISEAGEGLKMLMAREAGSVEKDFSILSQNFLVVSKKQSNFASATRKKRRDTKSGCEMKREKKRSLKILL